MWSRYLRSKERDGVVALFHELHPDPLFCSSEKWTDLLNGVCDISQALVSNLRERGLIVDTLERDHHEFEAAEIGLERKLNQARILYLMTAQGCNFGCKYCPIPEIAKKYGESLLSTEDAFAGIDLWQEHIRSVYDPDIRYIVIFYGGEPLLNKETVKASVGYIKMKRDAGELPTNLDIMIATNGVLIDDEMISLCKEHGVMITVGLDGPKSSNDVLKVDDGGAGTYDRVVSIIRLLVQNGIRTFASVSITPFNINHIAEYSEFFSQLGVEKFGFNFLKGRLLLELVGQDGLDSYYRQASRGVIENARRQNKRGFEHQMEKKLVAFDRKDFFPADCTCYGSQLVIQPDGQISNCPFFKAWLGHVRKVGKDFRIWNQSIVKEWRKRLPLYHDGEAKAVCGSGCAWSSIELKGDPLAVDDSSKIFSKEVLDELIWSRYDRLSHQEA